MLFGDTGFVWCTTLDAFQALLLFNLGNEKIKYTLETISTTAKRELHETWKIYMYHDLKI